jgi:hypothetical protein
MSRIWSVLIGVVLLFVAFLIVRSFKDSYESSSPEEPAQHAGVSAEALPEFQNWREFKDAEGKFKVLLPSLPQHVKDRFPDPLTHVFRKYDAFVITDSTPMIMIGAITLPEKLEGAQETEKVLKAVVDQIMSNNSKNHLESLVSGKFRSNPAIDFSMINGDATIVGKVFAHENTVYILTMGSSSVLFNPKEFSFFVNSFEPLDKK